MHNVLKTIAKKVLVRQKEGYQKGQYIILYETNGLICLSTVLRRHINPLTLKILESSVVVIESGIHFLSKRSIQL